MPTFAGARGLHRLPDRRRRDQARLALPQRRLHNSGPVTTILKVLRTEADTLKLPIRLEVLTGSKADCFYLRHGFVKLGKDAIEGDYERAVPQLT